MGKFNRVTLSLVLSLWTMGCKPKRQVNTSEVLLVRDVSEVQLSVIKERIPIYLQSMSFSYKQEGCFARGYLMSADLARWDVPIETLNQTASVAGQDLKTADGIRWSYHTAPQYYYRGQPYVIDPAHASMPLTKREWTDRNNRNGVPTIVTINERNELGNSYFAAYRFQHSQNVDLNGSVNGAFRARTLYDSTRWVSDMIGQESISPAEKTQKRQNLSILAKDIMRDLHTKNRLALEANESLAYWHNQIRAITGF